MEEGKPTSSDICRVCRSEGSSDRPLFYPCVCTGSIKYIHQDCLVQWLQYSKKEYCELCKHRFAFKPIYSRDMPSRLSIKELGLGIGGSMVRALRYWFQTSLVLIAWLGVVPLTACRIYRCLFTGSVSSLLTFPLDMVSTNNLLQDALQGCLVVGATLCAFISLVWLREQILNGNGPEWMDGGNRLLGMLGAEEEEDLAVQVDDEDDAPNNNNQAAGVAEVAGGEGWNGVVWDRAAEELTWERLLGLDGSLVFLEHVFWVISLNTLFILVFAFCPYHIGHILLVGLKLEDNILMQQFDGTLTTLLGYLIIAIALALLLAAASIAGIRRAQRVIGVCYIVVKVSLLVFVEVGIFPLVCGLWLDICSLSLFNTTMQQRLQTFNVAPGTTLFSHWLVGMIYVFYFASFILLLREVLRPGVLWFLRNLNDPDFNPINEMIHLPVYRHVRRFVASLVIFGSTVIVMLWVPIQLISKGLPSILPYQVTTFTEADTFSLEFLLLQVFLPAVLEQGHTRGWFKACMRTWCRGVAWLLGLGQYLLGDGTGAAGDAAAAGEGGLGAQHQALLLAGGPIGYEPYTRPRHFIPRLVLLLLVTASSMLVFSLIAFTVPVTLGRLVLVSLIGWKPHELYTVSCGLYLMWLIGRTIVAVNTFVATASADIKIIMMRFKSAMHLLGRASILVVTTGVILPLLMGLLFDLAILIPLKTSKQETPLIYLWHDWGLGFLQLKAVLFALLVGPNHWILRRQLEVYYNQGLRQMVIKSYLDTIWWPIVSGLILSLAVPYALVWTGLPLLGFSYEMVDLVYGRIYPAIICLGAVVVILVLQINQCQRLYERIKNDKYLVGQRLVNYDGHHAHSY